MKSNRIVSRLPLPFSIAMALAVGIAKANTITVTDPSDSSQSGICTLRDAIVSANLNNAGSSSCNAGNGADTIVFANNLSGSHIYLNQGALGVVATLTISGSGQIIDAQGTSQVISVGSNLSPLATLNVSSLTITGGSSSGNGAGLEVNYSTVTLTSVTLSGNSAASGGGAIYSYGGGAFGYDSVVTLNHATVRGNTANEGGGIKGNYRTKLVISDSVISGNSAITENLASPLLGKGGGLLSDGTTTLQNSQVTGNSSTGDGGGIFSDGILTLSHTTLATNSAVRGGGLANYNGNVNLLDSTVSRNLASYGGGLHAKGGSVGLFNSTVYKNSASEGGGTYSTGSASLQLTNVTVYKNSGSFYGCGIFSNNSSLNLVNTIVSGNNNSGALRGDLYDNNFSAHVTNSLLGSYLSNYYSGSSLVFTDSPGLYALTNNGGPTATLALHPDSPAIGVGSVALAVYNSYALSYDQRGIGFPRTLGGKVDIGAFQHQPTDRIFADPFESEP